MLFKKKVPRLPFPRLSRGLFACEDGGKLPIWTDEALFDAARVRVAFSERTGGVSAPPYDSLNLASHVGDDVACVQQNRRRLMGALGADVAALIVPKQVHGERVVSVGEPSAAAVEAARTEAGKGCDALLVEARGVAALLCFADCVPLVMVAPSGRFIVVHAGWRGVDNGIAVKALRKLMVGEPGLSVDASDVNVYRGACIHAECFQVGDDVHALFTNRYGVQVAPDSSHIDLLRALDADLVRAGIDSARIADVGECTVCNPQRWFTYRGAPDGVHGCHGALCVGL